MGNFEPYTRYSRVYDEEQKKGLRYGFYGNSFK